MRRARQDIQLRADEAEIVTLSRPKHHAMLAKSHGFGIAVGRHVPHGQNAAHLTSSVQTVKPASVLGPKELLIATSVASRPRAITTRPIRGMLFRGSNGAHRPRI